MNTNKLKAPSIIKDLYSRYYLSADSQGNAVSSHWKEFGSKIKVRMDADGNLLSFVGYGFGDQSPTIVFNRIFKYICNLSYFVRMSNKKDVFDLAKTAIPLVKKSGMYLSYDCFRQICSLSRIRQYFKFDKHDKFDILVIGDGYGFLSGLLKELYLCARITLVDIGKVLFFQAVNLQLMHPDKRHILIGRSEIKREDDFIYVPAGDLSGLGNIKYRLVINIASMQEMDRKTIEDYFLFIRRNTLTDNLFYCCNRQKKMLPDGESIEFLKYPWMDEDRHMIDEVCDFYKYHFSVMFPFVHKFDGLFLHRLTNLKTV